MFNWGFTFRFSLCIILLVLFFNRGVSQSIPTDGPISDEKLFDAINLNYSGLEEVREAVTKKDYIAAKLAYYNYRLTKSKAKWFINPNDKPVIAHQTFDAAADSVCEHYLGPGKEFVPPYYNMGNNLSWTHNPMNPSKSNFTNEWVWSLNRMNFWPTLINAYWKTLNEKYAAEWVFEMQDWVAKNPVTIKVSGEKTLAWRALESGLRMTSWMNAYYSIITSPSFSAVANADFAKGVLAHGWRLNYLSSEFTQYEKGNNHEIMANIGLANAALLFPEFKFAEEWKGNATRVLENCLRVMVYPDGVQFELAPGYHQWVRNYFFNYAKLAALNGVKLPDEYLATVKKMFNFGLYSMDPQGNLPQVNDSWPATADLEEAAVFWKDPQFEYVATKGKHGTIPSITSYKFTYAGFNIMRTGWDINSNYLFFKNGPIGTAHQHEDDLNILVNAYGKSLLTEGQNYIYDASKFRSFILTTPAHNTITVDGLSQYRAEIDNQRMVKKPSTQPWVTSPLIDFAAGVYDCGYQKLDYTEKSYRPIKAVGERDMSIIHKRNVIFLKPYYYVVADFLQGKGTHTFDAYFHLDAPDATVNKKSNEVNSMNKEDAQISLWAIDQKNLTTKSVIGQMNPILGWIPRINRKIPTIVFTKNQEAPASFATLLYPYQGSLPNVKTTMLNMGDDVWACSGETDVENFEIAIAKESATTISFQDKSITKFTTDALLVVSRHKKSSSDIWTELYDVSSFSSNQLSFSSEANTQLVIIHQVDKLILFNPSDDIIKLNKVSVSDKAIEIKPRQWVEITKDGVKVRVPIEF